MGKFFGLFGFIFTLPALLTALEIVTVAPKDGATVPLLGFGHALCKSTFEGVREQGLLGIFTGGIAGTAGGIAAAVLFGYLNALIFRSHQKK